MMKNKRILCILLSFFLLSTLNTIKGQSSNTLYTNGNKFKVTRYVFTDVNENVIERNDNIKQTTFIIDKTKKLFTVKMSTIYSEYYFYNTVTRISKNGKTIDAYSIYRSYNTSDTDKTLTSILELEINPTNKGLRSYKLLFGEKGFITFYVTPIK